MRRVLATDQGRELYSLRKQTIEPVFGQIKPTGASTASYEEAAPRCVLNGG